MRPKDLIALEVALWHFRDRLRVLEQNIPKSFSTVVISKGVLVRTIIVFNQNITR